MKFVSFVQLDGGSRWLAGICIAAFSAAGPKFFQKNPTLWMMLQMQLDWGGHAERPDLSPSYSSGARRFVRAGGKVLWSGEGATLTTRGASCVPPPLPALPQQEFLLKEVCSVAKIAGTGPQAGKQQG